MKALELVIYPKRGTGHYAKPWVVLSASSVDRNGQAKRLTDAELAAEHSAQMVRIMTIEKSSQHGIAGPRAHLKLRALHRFATLPHYDEDPK